MIIYDLAYLGTFVAFWVAIISLLRAYWKGWRPRLFRRKENATIQGS